MAKNTNATPSKPATSRKPAALVDPETKRVCYWPEKRIAEQARAGALDELENPFFGGKPETADLRVEKRPRGWVIVRYA